jgi:hypothetical protein
MSDSSAAEEVDIADVFQILIVDDGNTPNPLPASINANIESVRHHYSNAHHHLMNGNDIRQFLRGNFNAEVLEAYDLLTPYAYKADLARYCLLLARGGLYVDVGVRLLNPLRIPAGKSLAGFRDTRGSGSLGASWAFSTSVIYALAGREEMKLALDHIVANCRNRYYGFNPLCPSGPLLLGRVMAIVRQSHEYLVGEYRALTPEFDQRNLCFVAPDGELIGIRNKGKDAGDSFMGLPATNNYNDIWQRRQVYGESESFWSFADPMIRCRASMRTCEGIWIHPGARGCQIFGPYVSLWPGCYKATLKFSPDTVTGAPRLDVCGRGGNEIFADSGESGAAVSAAGEAFIAFTVDHPCKDVEIRLHGAGDFSGCYLGTTLSKAAQTRPKNLSVASIDGMGDD